MSDIFISYARSTETQARQVAECLRALGYRVWRDDELPAHRAYADVIEERLRAAKAVVVMWSAEAVKSQWVRAEAETALADGKLVQLSIDGAAPPMPFNQTQCAALKDWSGNLEAPGWIKVLASLAELTGGTGGPGGRAGPGPRRLAICVLPFANLSDDPQQEYFSDGITEDIITDLINVPSLTVVSRNTAFTFKGKPVEIPRIAAQLHVSHVLEGSVQKAGGRVRITAQLIDAAADDHLWAERFDRDLTDIFGLQDEISAAVVKALKLKLLPSERPAGGRRGTDSAEAYDLFLMARQQRLSGNFGDPRVEETTVRLCRRAVEIDPGYARAWATMAAAQIALRFLHGRGDIDTWATVDKALALDPNLSEAHAARSSHLRVEGRLEEALTEANLALGLDPQSHEANIAAANAYFSLGRFAEAIPHFDKTTAHTETEYYGAGLLITCHTALGDRDGATRAARICLEHAKAALAKDSANGAALGFGATALAVLGEADRSREWVRRALLMDPDNMYMRYNLACALSAHLGDVEGALDLLGRFFQDAATQDELAHARVDPDLDPVRGDARFQIMLSAADARLAAGDQAS